MERIGFVMRLQRGAEAEYRRCHAAVWPEMLAEFKMAGAANYSIFQREDDLFGYLEVEDFVRFRQHMNASAVNVRWQADMAPLIVGLRETPRPASTGDSMRSSTWNEQPGQTPGVR